jgi:hypothetical protein
MFAGETPASRRAERVAETSEEMMVVFQRAWTIAIRRSEPVGEGVSGSDGLVDWWAGYMAGNTGEQNMGREDSPLCFCAAPGPLREAMMIVFQGSLSWKS